MARKQAIDPKAVLRDQRGNIAVLFALLTVPLLGFAALAVDVGHLYVTRMQLQGAADAAVLAALPELPDLDNARATAIQYAETNMPAKAHGAVLQSSDVEIGTWDPDSRTFTAGGAAPDAVRVVTRRAAANGNPVPTAFAGLLGFNEVDVTAESIAVKGGGPVCLLALDPTASKAIEISGGGQILAPDCELHIHSTDTKATNLSGGSTITSDRTCIAGNYSGSGYTPEPETGCNPIPDPIAGTPPPAFAGCDHTDLSFSSGTETLTPGVYCGGISMSGGGTLDFEPGIYIIQDGPFTTSGGAIVQGEGVSFYLTGTDVEVDFSGGAGVDLSAPTSGPMAGLIFYQDPTANPGADNHFSGGANSSYEGTLYFPTQHITISGSGIAAFPPPHTMFIALTFTFTGSSQLFLGADYAASDVPRPPGIGGRFSRLAR